MKKEDEEADKEDEGPIFRNAEMKTKRQKKKKTKTLELGLQGKWGWVGFLRKWRE